MKSYKGRRFYTTQTEANFIDIKKWNKKQGYKEATRSNSKALSDIYSECLGKPFGHMHKRRPDSDPLSETEFDMLDEDVQRYAHRGHMFRD